MLVDLQVRLTITNTHQDNLTEVLAEVSSGIPVLPQLQCKNQIGTQKSDCNIEHILIVQMIDNWF